MTMWRTTSGQVIGLDDTFFNREVFHDFFDRERVLGRSDHLGEQRYSIEMAVTGRKRRVAVLDDEGAVIPGMPLEELIEKMAEAFRKTQIEIGGLIRYGEIDLGQVDMDIEEDLRIADQLDAEGKLSAVSSPSPEEAASEEETDGEDVPDYPMLIVSDLALAEVPALASSSHTSVAVFPHGNTRAIVSSGHIDMARKIFPKPVFLLTLRMMGEDSPVLTVQVDNKKPVIWRWEGEPEVLEWMKDDESALNFADEYLGAGAVARTSVLDIAEASALDVRNALLSTPTLGPAFLIQALKLPPEVVDVLLGSATVDDIPDAQVFESRSFSQTIKDIVALEISGEGVANSKLWKVYRTFYLDHPIIMNAVASLQAAAGGTLFAASLKSSKGTVSKWGAGIGAFLMVNALSRVITTQWVQEAIARSESTRRLNRLTAEARARQVKAETGGTGE